MSILLQICIDATRPKYMTPRLIFYMCTVNPFLRAHGALSLVNDDAEVLALFLEKPRAKGYGAELALEGLSLLHAVERRLPDLMMPFPQPSKGAVDGIESVARAHCGKPGIERAAFSKAIWAPTAQLDKVSALAH